jgi:hypothetical protein
MGDFEQVDDVCMIGMKVWLSTNDFVDKHSNMQNPAYSETASWINIATSSIKKPRINLRLSKDGACVAW